MARQRSKAGDLGVAVAYVRVSRDGQDLSPEAQRAAIDAWCARQGVQLAACFADEGVSGAASLDTRAGLQAALESLEAHGAGVLVVARRDRIARDVVIAAMVERLAERAGAQVVSADGAGNGDGPEAQMMRAMLDVFAQYERAMIRQRTKAALAAKRARGFRAGAVPFGYVAAADGRLTPHPAEQRVVALVAALRAEGLTYRAIAARLTAAGHRPRSGRTWHPQTVSNIVRAAS